MNPENTPVPNEGQQPAALQPDQPVAPALSSQPPTPSITPETPQPSVAPVPDAAVSQAGPTVNPVTPPQPTVMDTSAPQQPIGPTAHPITGGNNQTLIIVIVIVGLMAVLGGLGFAASKIFSSKVKQSPAVTSQSAADAERQKALAELEAEEKAKTQEQTDAPAAGITELKDKIIVDAEMGYTITAKSIAIGVFDVKGSDSFRKGKTVVAVQFANKDSNKFSGSAKNVMLSLLNSKNSTCMEQTSQYKIDMAAKNMVPLSDAKEQADTVTGWNVYACESDSISQLTLKYRRLAATVIGSQQTIPAKDFTIQLR